MKVHLKNDITVDHDRLYAIQSALWKLHNCYPLLFAELGYYSREPKHGCFGDERGVMVELGLLQNDGSMDAQTLKIVSVCLEVKGFNVEIMSPYDEKVKECFSW